MIASFVKSLVILSRIYFEMRINLQNYRTDFSLFDVAYYTPLPSVQKESSFCWTRRRRTRSRNPRSLFTPRLYHEEKNRAHVWTRYRIMQVSWRGWSIPQFFVSEKESRQILHGALLFRCRSDWFTVTQRLRNSTAWIKELDQFAANESIVFNVPRLVILIINFKCVKLSVYHANTL